MYVSTRFPGGLYMHLLWTACLCSLQIHMFNEVLTLSAMVFGSAAFGRQVDLDEIVKVRPPQEG